MSGPDAWIDEVIEQRMRELWTSGRGRLATYAVEAVGSHRRLATELGVSMRTVQRWVAWEQGRTSQGRDPRRSPERSRLERIAREALEEEALDELYDEASDFDSDGADVNYLTDEGEDEGWRHARSVVEPLDNRAWVDAYRAGDRPAAASALQAALGRSYGLPPSVVLSDIERLRLHR